MELFHLSFILIDGYKLSLKCKEVISPLGRRYRAYWVHQCPPVHSPLTGNCSGYTRNLWTRRSE